MRSVWGAHASRVLVRRRADSFDSASALAQDDSRGIRVLTDARSARKLSICTFADSFARYNDD